MSSRALFTAIPTLLFALALAAGTSCSGEVTNYPPLSGAGTGGATTAQSSSSSSSGGKGSASSSTSSTGSMGTGEAGTSEAGMGEAGTGEAGMGEAGTGEAGTGDACASMHTCSVPSDCPTPSTPCLGSVCDDGCCSTSEVAKGTPCAEDGGSDGGGTVCNGGGLCVPPSCADGILDGEETDVDCGGPMCTACGTGKMCNGEDANCQSHVCTNACQASTCTDGVQNGNETDIDCGGLGYMGAPACPPCNPGKKCNLPGDCVGDLCQTTCQCPSGMLVVPIQGAGIYCIESLEVSYSSYDVFYNANPSTTIQDPWCSWNVGWTPAGAWPYAQIVQTEPVRYVNWCQAAAYCKYQGRRLCGKIGGGSVAQASFADYTTDQWFNACTAQDANCNASGCYPYGTAYGPTNCNGIDSVDGGSHGPEVPSSLMACQGGEVGLFNMSGNVAEWEDSCDATSGENDDCAIRGGSYLDDAGGLRCDSAQSSLPITQPRSYTGNDVGFRCCL